ncbi:cell wall-binding repeat-containing protein [Dactylosporangium sp. NPDC005555]|uniref:cell wall-binding repeat-containing protein n=1 Tax=Dactylosporangium sp. NPDC005555 TaxID=3154889 RepID=UPI0033B24CC9
MTGLSRRMIFKGAATTAVAGAASPALLSGSPAAAQMPGTGGLITYAMDATSRTYLAKADGTPIREMSYSTKVSWSPDGSRYVHGQIVGSERTDGSDPVLNLHGSYPSPVYDPTGRFVYWIGVYSTSIMYIGADGSWAGHSAKFYEEPSQQQAIQYIAVAPGGTVFFTRGHPGNNSVLYRVTSASTSVQVLADAYEPDISPDGSTIAFQREAYVSVDGGYWPGAQLWLANIDGSNPRQITFPETHGLLNRSASWSPDGTTLLFNAGHPTTWRTGALKRLTVASGAITQVVGDGLLPSQQPVKQTKDTVRRVWGDDQILTAVAASRYAFADHGSAGDPRPKAAAVVLSRADLYYDALGGSALAVARQAPLLITGNRTLDPKVLAEIGRVLAPGGTVYVLGGELALPRGIETSLTAAGYKTKRIGGADQFDTAVRIAREMSARPTTVVLATAHMYYDALAAGATLGVLPDQVLVLCDGHRMPASTAAYLNGIDPDTQDVVCVGGWALPALQNAYAAGMLPSWDTRDGYVYEASGERAEDTAIAVAKFFWTSPNRFAVATTSTWFDALTGGAAIGTARGPLLITAPNALDPAVRSYLSACSPTAAEVVMLGGRLALPEAMVAKLGAAIAEPGGWQSAETTPSSPAPAGQAQSLRAAGGRESSLAAAKPPVPRPRPDRVQVR